MAFIAPIVEGHGEVQAVPNLLHRVALEISETADLRVNNPIRVKSGSFLNDPDYFSKMIHLASAKAAQADGSVLILLDCEDDCPARLGPELLRRAHDVRNDVPVCVALVFREYETWFITAVQSLVGQYGIQNGIQAPGDPTDIRNAKGWMTEHMDVAYDPILHQLPLTRIFDLQLAPGKPIV